MEDKPEVKVGENLKAKEDGRKKAWWIKKIEKLEEELADLRKHSVTINKATDTVSLDTVSFCEGYMLCMSSYQIASKAVRRRMKEQILTNGPGVVKNNRRDKFRGVSL